MAADPGLSAAGFHAALTVAVIGFDDPDGLREQLSAEELSFLSGRLGTACAVAASEFGGKLVHQTGGPRILVFGVPTLHELDAERAVLAAQKVLRTFGRDGFGHPVRLRCGVASGDGTIVLDQGPNTAPFEITGTATDQAKRLESEAPQGVLLISPETHALFRSDFMARKVQLQNGTETVFEVSPAVSPMARNDSHEADRAPPPFTGRSNELGTLRICWEAAKQGTPQTIMLVGEPGIGKSSLIRALMKETQADHPLVLSFYGSVHHRRTPFYPIAQGLYTFLGLKGLQSPTLLATVIQQLLDDLGLDTRRHRANLSAILKGGGLDSTPLQLNKDVDAPNETLVACLERLAAIHPVLLVYEDAHWMDISTLESVCLLQQKLGKSRLMTLVSRRPGKTAVDLTGAVKLTCRVGQLREDQTRKLAGLLRPETMSDAHFEQIVQRSDGIPLFLEELMNNAAEDGGTDPAVAASARVPASLRETLAARLSHLGKARDLLLQAAVIGREFVAPLLQDITGKPANRLKDHLMTLQRANLIYRKGAFEEGLFEFKHSLVQELAYQSLAPHKRKSCHRAIADALTQTPDRYPPVAVEVIARHFERGGDVTTALDYLELAGMDAVRVAAHRDAGRYFGKALELAQEIDDTAERERTVSRFLLLLGPQLIAKHGFASNEVREVYCKARSLSSIETGSAEVLQMLWGLWGAHMVKAEVGFAKQLSDDFLRHAMIRQDPIEVTAGHYMSGVGAFYTGALEDAETSMLAAVEASSTADFEEMVTRYSLDLGILARSYLSWCYALLDRPDALRDNCLSLETASLLSDHAFCRAFSSCFMATAFNFADDRAEAERHALTAMDLSRQEGFAQQLAQAEINLGRARSVPGDKSGLRLMEAGLKAYLATGAVLARPYAEAWIAEARLVDGDPQTVLEMLTNVRRFTLRSGERYFDAELYRLTARAAGMTRPDTHPLVRQLLAKAERQARQTGSRLHLARTSKAGG
ncbi:ATP-binding protein [Roseibium sediminicola]|uniref:AAA family ATPase n=1 Tax=Roseibium sediminicola TaxID=2933272 RepID=A0ABT0H1D3_9HYPH|nr:AAA family ATPase [Roseibium sp. CAU 1639]